MLITELIALKRAQGLCQILQIMSEKQFTAAVLPAVLFISNWSFSVSTDLQFIPFQVHSVFLHSSHTDAIQV